MESDVEENESWRLKRRKTKEDVDEAVDGHEGRGQTGDDEDDYLYAEEGDPQTGDDFDYEIEREQKQGRRRIKSESEGYGGDKGGPKKKGEDEDGDKMGRGRRVATRVAKDDDFVIKDREERSDSESKKKPNVENTEYSGISFCCCSLNALESESDEVKLPLSIPKPNYEVAAYKQSMSEVMLVFTFYIPEY